MESINGMAKVLWAVDPIPEDKKLQFKTAQALARLTKNSGVVIEPVCVLSADRLRVPMAAFRTDAKKYQIEAETLLKSWVKSLKIPNLISPRFLVHGITADTDSISGLLEYARETGAQLIGLAAHTRKRWQRFFLGSFAETMILRSDIPLLVVQATSVAPTKFSRILFPTDFSDVSRVAFRALLPTAQALKARIILYYKFDYITPLTAETINIYPAYSGYLQADRENKMRMSTEWMEEASQAGVKTDFILDEKPCFVPDGILKALKKSKADLIAMASHSGKYSSAFMGSITRQTVRSAPVPVWVIHPAKGAVSAQRDMPKSIGVPVAV